MRDDCVNANAYHMFMTFKTITQRKFINRAYRAVYLYLSARVDEAEQLRKQ